MELMLKVDTKVKCHVRISLCVTEDRNEQNIPLMLYTPTRDDYVENFEVDPGMDQVLECSFNLE